ncbi:kinase-like domain-containing protein [Tuber borchii]|uniref:Kinase-like domain-containing protein n=1 Tax=Tuber borchii TaxID=42251 RepID=A0A2T6ZQU9_TUBBO|nr:kinase-like domain-containing protein [Tuber borchii]
MGISSRLQERLNRTLFPGLCGEDNQGELSTSEQDQQASILVSSQSRPPGPTLPRRCVSTNTYSATTHQRDSRFASRPAAFSPSARTRYAPYRLPNLKTDSPPPRKIAGSHFPVPTSFPSPPPSIPVPKPEVVGVHHSPVREPPAWRLNCKIGTGACGTVFLENVQIPGMKSPELWAVKRIPRALQNFTSKRYEAEINNLQLLARHEWFVKFNSTYEDTHYMYIAMEYIPMGDMSQSFADGYRWNESDTKIVIKQLLHGLTIMHKEGITHRDLKPENIFLYLPENQTQVLRVKIGDFGTSKRIPHSNASTYLKTTTGTQGYMAPEAHDTSQPKTNRVDIWSLGCILYRMFAGKLLFNDPVQVWKYALTASSSTLALDNIGLSIRCVSFLHDILQPIPEDRPSAEDCLKKAWIMSQASELEYSIGNDLYTRLSEIGHPAPNVHSFPDIVANLTVDSSSTPRRPWLL